MCTKSEAFEIIRLALQGGIGGLQIHSKTKTFLLHQKFCTGGNQLYNISTIALALLRSISLTVHEASAGVKQMHQ